jgi:hypothetical protein
MDFILSRRVQMTSLVSFMGLAILAVIETLRSLTEMIHVNGPASVAFAVPIALAAGLITWVAKSQFEGEPKSETPA